jgi:hypothetical protein
MNNVNIKVSIPFGRGGYGQFDQWESGEVDHTVSIAPNGNVKLTAPDQSVILFSRDDLDAALRALNYNKPVMRTVDLTPEPQA